MKQKFKSILPIIIALILIIPSLLIRIPSEVEMTFDSRHFSFFISKSITDFGNVQDSDTLVEIIKFSEFRTDKLELSNFDHVFLEQFDLEIWDPKSASFIALRRNTNLEIIPSAGRWKKFAKVNFKTDNELTLFVQSLQTVYNSKFQVDVQDEDWLLIQIDEPSDSPIANHKPEILIVQTGPSLLNIERCQIIENESVIESITVDTPMKITPTSDHSVIKLEGEDRRISLNAHFPSEQLRSYSKVEMYDPQTDEWQGGLAPIPTPRQQAVTAVVNDKIFVIGGDRREAKLEILSNRKAHDLSLKNAREPSNKVSNIRIHYLKSAKEDIKVPKTFLELSPLPFDISSIHVGNRKIICSIRGSTKGAKIESGTKKISLSPRLLEWIYENQFLASIFGAIVWLVGTLYIVVKKW